MQQHRNCLRLTSWSLLFSGLLLFAFCFLLFAFCFLLFLPFFLQILLRFGQGPSESMAEFDGCRRLSCNVVDQERTVLVGGVVGLRGMGSLPT